MGKPKGGKGTKGGKGRAGVKGKFATQNVYTPEERSQAYLVKGRGSQQDSPGIHSFNMPQQEAIGSPAR